MSSRVSNGSGNLRRMQDEKQTSNLFVIGVMQCSMDRCSTLERLMEKMHTCHRTGLEGLHAAVTDAQRQVFVR